MILPILSMPLILQISEMISLRSEQWSLWTKEGREAISQPPSLRSSAPASSFQHKVSGGNITSSPELWELWKCVCGSGVSYDEPWFPVCIINHSFASLLLYDITLPCLYCHVWRVTRRDRLMCDNSILSVLTRDYHANRVFTPSYQNTDNELRGIRK